MSERKNVRSEHKWVGRSGWDDEGPQFHWSTGGWKVRVRKPETATLYDSPSDVPDDCTPVRVRVETWEEEGKPEPWDYKDTRPVWFLIYELDDGWEIIEPSPTYPDPVRHHKAREILESVWARIRKGSLTAIPVRIPTETKRKVTLDPEPEEPTETGCRCREKVIRAVVGFDPVFGHPLIPIDYTEGVRDVQVAVLNALECCDCTEADDE